MIIIVESCLYLHIVRPACPLLIQGCWFSNHREMPNPTNICPNYVQSFPLSCCSRCTIPQPSARFRTYQKKVFYKFHLHFLFKQTKKFEIQYMFFRFEQWMQIERIAVTHFAKFISLPNSVGNRKSIESQLFICLLAKFWKHNNIVYYMLRRANFIIIIISFLSLR